MDSMEIGFRITVEEFDFSVELVVEEGFGVGASCSIHTIENKGKVFPRE